MEKKKKAQMGSTTNGIKKSMGREQDRPTE